MRKEGERIRFDCICYKLLTADDGKETDPEQAAPAAGCIL